jgi:hypothetical protein
MAEYVLVGGAWLGGWCWKPIARQLRNQGHEAYPVTLSGLGERSHLASPELDLETHITEIVSIIEFEDLRWHTGAWNVQPVRYGADLRTTQRLTLRARDDATGHTDERRFYAGLPRRRRRTNLPGAPDHTEQDWRRRREVDCGDAHRLPE